MNKRVAAVVFIAFIVGGTSILVLVNFGINDQPYTIDVEWGVNVGDTFVFHLIVTGGNYTEFGANVTAPAYADFNQTTIRAQITNLPELPTETDNESFLSEVILPFKFNCSFENSSALPESLRARLTEVLSWTLLPIGDWDSLNGLYNMTDQYTDWSYDIWEHKRCYTSLETDFFNIVLSQQKNWLHPIFESWTGALDLATGVATTAIYSDADFSCIGSGYSVQLTLHLIE